MEYNKCVLLTGLLVSFSLQAKEQRSFTVEKIEQALTNITDDREYELLLDCVEQATSKEVENLGVIIARRSRILTAFRDSFFRNNIGKIWLSIPSTFVLGIVLATIDEHLKAAYNISPKVMDIVIWLPWLIVMINEIGAACTASALCLYYSYLKGDKQLERIEILAQKQKEQYCCP